MSKISSLIAEHVHTGDMNQKRVHKNMFWGHVSEWPIGYALPQCIISKYTLIL